MSGGSYNYLCHKEVNELMGCDEMLNKMAERLSELGHHAASRATHMFVLELWKACNRLEVMREDLEGVWTAVEWFDSGDWGRESVDKAVSEWLGATESK